MYQVGQLATLADYNNIADQALFFYGTGYRDRGYGQSAILVDILDNSQSYLNSADRWLRLRNSINICCQHQNSALTYLPPTTEFVIGNLIKAYESTPPTNSVYDWGQQFDIVDQNRFKVGPLSSAVELVGATIVRNSPWGNISTPSIFCDIEFTFDSENSARYFFNSGGEIRFAINHPVGNAIDNSWRSFLNSIVGEIRFSAHNTKTLGSHTVNNSSGYYELTDNYTDILDYNGNGGYGYGYGGNIQTINIKSKFIGPYGNNGGQGSTIRFRITLTDSYTGPQFVSAGTTINTTCLRAVTYLQNIQAPNRNIIIDLN